jgi:site-specific DNA-cytosine methylase
MRALSLCGGGEFCYLAMRDAGLAVGTWDCVELDKDARMLAKALVPQANHLPPHDITKMDPDIITNGDYDTVILTSPCQPFSVLPTDPK